MAMNPPTSTGNPIASWYGRWKAQNPGMVKASTVAQGRPFNANMPPPALPNQQLGATPRSMPVIPGSTGMGPMVNQQAASPANTIGLPKPIAGSSPLPAGVTHEPARIPTVQPNPAPIRPDPSLQAEPSTNWTAPMPPTNQQGGAAGTTQSPAMSRVWQNAVFHGLNPTELYARARYGALVQGGAGMTPEAIDNAIVTEMDRLIRLSMPPARGVLDTASQPAPPAPDPNLQREPRDPNNYWGVPPAPTPSVTAKTPTRTGPAITGCRLDHANRAAPPAEGSRCLEAPATGHQMRRPPTGICTNREPRALDHQAF